jgi:hypothetical protein
VEDKVKSAPFTFSVNPELPTIALAGEKPTSIGTGLFTVKVMATDGPLPGLATVTSGVPATVMALAGMVACNEVGL